MTAEAPEVHDIDQFHIHYQLPQCFEKYRLSPYKRDDDSFQISLNGWLLQESQNIPYSQFCYELLQTDSGFQYIAVVCIMENPNDGLDIITIGALIISIPFLFTTFLVYLLTKKLRDLHGKCLICHVLSLLMAYTSVIIVQVKTNEVDSIVCVILGK